MQAFHTILPFILIKGSNASTPKAENIFANTPADNSLPVNAGLCMFTKLLSQIANWYIWIILAEHQSNGEVPYYPSASFADVSIKFAVTILVHLITFVIGLSSK